MEFGAVAGIAAVALGLVLTPGPNMIYLVSRSITQGRRAGLVSLGGVAVGFCVYLVAVTAGIVAVFAVVPIAYTTIKLAGAGYLLWLAWKAVKPGGESVFAPGPLPPDTPRRLFTMGLVTCLLNPRSRSCTCRCCRSSSTRPAGTSPSRACCSG
jgi:threonine/homoserine/homoserine lactone efflux protein